MHRKLLHPAHEVLIFVMRCGKVSNWVVAFGKGVPFGCCCMAGLIDKDDRRQPLVLLTFCCGEPVNSDLEKVYSNVERCLKKL